MPTARVVAVVPGSPAHAAGLLPGDELLTLNGEAVRDVIRYQIQADEPRVELELRRGGLEQLVVVDKAAGAPLGLDLESAVFDRVRTCDNHCPFCFIYQLPKGMRRSLYLKDDDYRLSFLYGNFTTLTRFTEADLERVLSEQLGPLYVSIHSTDPELRTRLLRNRRGATSLRWLSALLDGGIEVHGQVVVCPGINDGEALDDTLLGVLDRFPRLATVGVVPLGVSDYTTEPDMRAHTRAEAVRVLDIVEAVAGALHARARPPARVRRRRVLPARRAPVPHDHRLRRAVAARERHRHGALVRSRGARRARGRDGRRHGHPRRLRARTEDGLLRVGRRRARRRIPRAARSPRRCTFRTSTPAPVTIVTGEYGAQVLEPLVDELATAARADVSLLVVDNRFFGGNIAVTGLLTGADVARALDAAGATGRRPATSCPTSSSRTAASSTARRPRSCPGRSRSWPPTARRSSRQRSTTVQRRARAQLPVVAIVGRPNVGKSTLVNRFVGRRDAIVQEQPGVTRDRKELHAEWNGRKFVVVDTGGWLAPDSGEGSEPLARMVSRQAERALVDADVILFVVDGTVGLIEEDERVARVLYKTNKPVFVDRQQGRRRTPRGRRVGVPEPRPR